MHNHSTTQAAHSLVEEVRELHMVQLTDCHLFADPDAHLQDYNTRLSFERVLDAIGKNEPACDLLLATGDLSQDESAGSYRYLASKLDALGIPVAWLPGNHDDLSVMAESFHGENILEERHLLLGNWHLVLLDSTIPGQVQGRVSAEQITFMHDSLLQHADRHALVCLHHPAIPCGSDWLDQKSLTNHDQFRRAVLRHDQVRGVVWGHVHQEGNFQRDDKLWLSSPSTCIQFKPDSAQFALDNQPPGYRRLILGTDGRIDSAVIRVS